MLRKQAEEKLVAREQFLRKLTDQLPGMVGYWTRELRCSFANKAYLFHYAFKMALIHGQFERRFMLGLSDAI